LEGELPPRVLELAKEELLDDWNLIQATGKFNKIQPLV
jgi:hypothetical protein